MFLIFKTNLSSFSSSPSSSYTLDLLVDIDIRRRQKDESQPISQTHEEWSFDIMYSEITGDAGNNQEAHATLKRFVQSIDGTPAGICRGHEKPSLDRPSSNKYIPKVYVDVTDKKVSRCALRLLLPVSVTDNLSQDVGVIAMIHLDGEVSKDGKPNLFTAAFPSKSDGEMVPQSRCLATGIDLAYVVKITAKKASSSPCTCELITSHKQKKLEGYYYQCEEPAATKPKEPRSRARRIGKKLVKPVKKLADRYW